MGVGWVELISYMSLRDLGLGLELFAALLVVRIGWGILIADGFGLVICLLLVLRWFKSERLLPAQVKSFDDNATTYFISCTGPHHVTTAIQPKVL